jgi:hypothetical protein
MKWQEISFLYDLLQAEATILLMYYVCIEIREEIQEAQNLHELSMSHKFMSNNLQFYE